MEDYFDLNSKIQKKLLLSLKNKEIEHHVYVDLSRELHFLLGYLIATEESKKIV